MGTHDTNTGDVLSTTCWRCGAQYDGLHQCQFDPSFGLQLTPRAVDRDGEILAELRAIRALLERLVKK